jgi:HupE / UreJ protein
MSAPKASNRGQSAQPNGQGFAAALREVGLPEHAIPLALAFFNVGVELGQLLFIGAVFGLLWLMRPLGRALSGSGDTWRQAKRLSVPAAYLVGTVAMFWVFERTYSYMG